MKTFYNFGIFIHFQSLHLEIMKYWIEFECLVYFTYLQVVCDFLLEQVNLGNLQNFRYIL